MGAVYDGDIYDDNWGVTNLDSNPWGAVAVSARENHDSFRRI